MIITVLTQKYSCGCGKGILKETTPNLLDKLNRIVDWSKVNWPMKTEGEKTIPDTKFLGTPPILKPGDMFLWEGSILAIDDTESIVLVISETGPKSASRFIQYLEDENSFLNKKQQGSNLELTIEELPWCDIDLLKENLEEYTTQYSRYKPMIDGCDNKDLLRKRKLTIKETATSNPVTIYLDRQTIFYDPNELSQDNLEKLVMEIYDWVIKNKNKEDN
jgi:hypothetical protein